jgi:hypothetical protein
MRLVATVYLTSPGLPERNHKLQERKKHHQGAHFAKADKDPP